MKDKIIKIRQYKNWKIKIKLCEDNGFWAEILSPDKKIHRYTPHRNDDESVKVCAENEIDDYILHHS